MHAFSSLQSCKTCSFSNNLVTEAWGRNSLIFELLVTVGLWWGQRFPVLIAYGSPAAWFKMPNVIGWAWGGAWESFLTGLRGCECCQSVALTWSSKDQHMATHMDYCPEPPASSNSGIWVHFLGCGWVTALMEKVRRIYVFSIHVNIVTGLQSATRKSRNRQLHFFEQEM